MSSFHWNNTNKEFGLIIGESIEIMHHISEYLDFPVCWMLI